MLPIQLQLSSDFYKEEVKNDFLVTRSRKEVWAVELDLLMQFDKVCKKNNLTYFLDGGTLLGAVRHKGFIPWDDDIDVEMFREDYDKLVSIADQEFEHPYFFQSAYSDKGYVRSHSQLRNSNTCGALSHEVHKVSFNQGIFLDIFVLDGVPDDQEKLDEQMRFLQKYSAKMWEIVCPRMNSRIKYMVKIIRRQIYIRFGILKSMYRRFEECAKTYEDSEEVALLTFYRNSEHIKRFPKEWYHDTLLMPFETLMCPIPSGYREILTLYYGEHYMIPQKAENCHGELIIDTKRSYKEVLKGMK